MWQSQAYLYILNLRLHCGKYDRWQQSQRMVTHVMDDCSDTCHAFLVFTREGQRARNDEWFYFMKLDVALKSKCYTGKIRMAHSHSTSFDCESNSQNSTLHSLRWHFGGQERNIMFSCFVLIIIQRLAKMRPYICQPLKWLIRDLLLGTAGKIMDKMAGRNKMESWTSTFHHLHRINFT